MKKLKDWVVAGIDALAELPVSSILLLLAVLLVIVSAFQLDLASQRRQLGKTQQAEIVALQKEKDFAEAYYRACERHLERQDKIVLELLQARRLQGQSVDEVLTKAAEADRLLNVAKARLTELGDQNKELCSWVEFYRDRYIKTSERAAQPWDYLWSATD